MHPLTTFLLSPRRSWWVWAALLSLGLLWRWGAAAQRPPAPGTLRLTVLDVGQGDCLLLQTPNGRTVLIDGGGANDEDQAAQSDIGDRTVLPFLRYEGINRIDVLVLTHPHGDHAGGLAAVLREEPVGVVLDGTRLPYPSPAYTTFLDLVQRKHIPYEHAVRGMRLTLDQNVIADVLNPPATGYAYGTEPDNDTVNNYSVVLRVTYGCTHLLLDGDAEDAAESSMLAAFPSLTADVLKCGHHGAKNATGDAWLARVRPRYAAVSCGLHNPFGHPNPDTLVRLAAHQVEVFRTDKNGAVTFTSDGKTVTAKPFLP